MLIHLDYDKWWKLYERNLYIERDRIGDIHLNDVWEKYENLFPHKFNMDFGDRPPTQFNRYHPNAWMHDVVDYDARNDTRAAGVAAEVTQNLPDEVAAIIIDQTAERPFRVAPRFNGRGRPLQRNRNRSAISLVYTLPATSGGRPARVREAWNTETDGIDTNLPLLVRNDGRLWVRMPGTFRYAGIREADSARYYRRHDTYWSPQHAIVEQAREYWQRAEQTRRRLRRPVARRVGRGRRWNGGGGST